MLTERCRFKSVKNILVLSKTVTHKASLKNKSRKVVFLISPFKLHIQDHMY